MLLSFMDVEVALRVIKEFDFEFSQIFASLERWMSGPNLPLRTVWVKCFGVPLYAWNPKVFKEIGGRLEEVLGVAKETTERSVLEYGRVCIQTSIQQFINQSIRLENFGKVFSITIRKELEGFKSTKMGDFGHSFGLQQHGGGVFELEK